MKPFFFLNEKKWLIYPVISQAISIKFKYKQVQVIFMIGFYKKIVSRWYRAPEIILSMGDYSTAGKIFRLLILLSLYSQRFLQIGKKRFPAVIGTNQPCASALRDPKKYWSKINRFPGPKFQFLRQK